MKTELLNYFIETFHKDPEIDISNPGRAELSGNHTDHQHGRVLCTPVSAKIYAAVSENGDQVIRVYSKGHNPAIVDLSQLDPVPAEEGTSISLVRGIASKMKSMGFSLKGFDCCTISEVLTGSGLSSSAAFEILIARIINEVNGCGLTPFQMAQVSQFAENRFYGKPCGLMDQIACAYDGPVAIDFEPQPDPVITPLKLDLDAYGYDLCVIDSGAGHEDLTDEYAAVTRELKDVCRFFGKEVLREIPEEEFYDKITDLRQNVGDRPVLRAIHVYNENARVLAQTKALQDGDFDQYLQLVKESGKSSWMLIQNIIPCGRIKKQELGFALAVTERFLEGKGACRVQGGGFAGTLQAYVPKDMTADFLQKIEKILGAGSCKVLSIPK